MMGMSARKQPTKIEVEELDEFLHLDDGVELDEGERAKLNEALKRSWAQAQAGEGISGEELLAKLRSR